MTVKPQFQILTVAVVAFVAYGLFAQVRGLRHNDMATTTVAKFLPPVQFYDSFGNGVTLDDFKGKVVLVNLWATWCPPCVEELPSLDMLQSELKHKGFRVVAISVDHTSMETITAFLDGRGIENLDAYWDKRHEIPAQWNYAGIPVSFIIGRDGHTVAKVEGAHVWDHGALFDRINALVTAPE